MTASVTKAATALLSMILATGAGCTKHAPQTGADSGTKTSSAAGGPSAVSLVGEPCVIVDKATVAVNTVDHASVITTAMGGGAPRTGETRVVGGKSYVEVNGDWQVSKTSPAENAAMMAEERKSAKETCQALGDETVAGVSTAVFSAHVENDGSVSDNKIWIAKDSGLPVKTVSTLEGNTVVTQMNTYSGVIAPQT